MYPLVILYPSAIVVATDIYASNFGVYSWPYKGMVTFRSYSANLGNVYVTFDNCTFDRVPAYLFKRFLHHCIPSGA